MNSLPLAGASARRPLPAWLPVIAGLTVAALVAAWVCPLPRFHGLSWNDLLGSAVERVLAVFLSCFVTVWTILAIRPENISPATRRLALRTSLDAIWLAPLAHFIRENSLWTMPIAAVLAASVARSIHSLQSHSAPNTTTEDPAPSDTDLTFRLAESSPWFWRQCSAFAAALCAQTGALVGFADHPFASAVLIGVSAAAWMWSFTIYSERPGRRDSTSRSRLALIASVGIVLTAVALLPFLRSTLAMSGFGVPSQKRSRHSSSQPRPHAPQGTEKTSDAGTAGLKPRGKELSEGIVGAPKDENSGVILLPEKPTLTELVAPAPAMADSVVKSDRHASPLVIPFNGVYWFFKSPDVQPPETSRQTHGSPELLDIHSTDRRPLSMEAHEYFGSLIDLNCCSRIQVAIRNADVYPQTVSLELLLINTTLPGKPAQSLGSMMVKSTRPWQFEGKQSSTSETLNFSLPANLAIRSFDEVKIVFRMQAFRADDGARIAIDRFVLVPRGL